MTGIWLFKAWLCGWNDVYKNIFILANMKKLLVRKIITQLNYTNIFCNSNLTNLDYISQTDRELIEFFWNQLIINQLARFVQCVQERQVKFFWNLLLGSGRFAVFQLKRKKKRKVLSEIYFTQSYYIILIYCCILHLLLFSHEQLTIHKIKNDY